MLYLTFDINVISFNKDGLKYYYKMIQSQLNYYARDVLFNTFPDQYLLIKKGLCPQTLCQ